jgi:hypothetical protein
MRLALFGLALCVYYEAPFWVYLVGLLCMLRITTEVRSV